MASSESDTDCSSASEIFESDYEVEVEIEVCDTSTSPPAVRESTSELECYDDFDHYAGEPLADEEWMKQYEKDMEETAKLEEKLQKRLSCIVPVSEW
jgi:hypothetical protein